MNIDFEKKMRNFFDYLVDGAATALILGSWVFLGFIFGYFFPLFVNLFITVMIILVVFYAERGLDLVKESPDYFGWDIIAFAVLSCLFIFLIGLWVTILVRFILGFFGT